MFHLTFAEGEGIAHDVAFSVNLLEQVEQAPQMLWGMLSLLSKTSIKKSELQEYWSQKKILSPSSVVKTLLTEPVLAVIRRELNRESPARLDVQDVFNAVRDTLSKEALAEAGDLSPRRKKRKKRKIHRKDPITGQMTEQEVEEEDSGSDAGELAASNGRSSAENAGIT